MSIIYGPESLVNSELMDLRLIIEPSIGLGNVQEEGKGLPFVVAFCLSEEMGIDSSLC
jgi:hypothetical protein